MKVDPANAHQDCVVADSVSTRSWKSAAMCHFKVGRNQLGCVVSMLLLFAIACGHSGDPALTRLLVTSEDLGRSNWQVQDVSDKASSNKATRPPSVDGCEMTASPREPGAMAKISKSGSDDFVVVTLFKTSDLVSETREFLSKCANVDSRPLAQARLEPTDLPASKAIDQVGYRIAFSTYNEVKGFILVGVAHASDLSILTMTSAVKAEQPPRDLFDPIFVKQIDRVISAR